MSTLAVTSLKNEASASNNIVLNTDGTVTLSGSISGAVNFSDAVTFGSTSTFSGVVTAEAGAVAAIDTLTDGATITPDLASGCNFAVTLGGNRTLANPSNITAGQSGSIFIVQDGTGSRTLSWGSYWDFPGGTAPTLTTTSGAVDRVDYVVRSTTSIHTVFTANYS